MMRSMAGFCFLLGVAAALTIGCSGGGQQAADDANGAQDSRAIAQGDDKTAASSGTPASSDAPDTPAAPHSPDEPSTPAKPSTTDHSVTPATSNTRDEPQAPVTPKTPDTAARSSLPQQGEPLDTTYISDDFFAAVVVNPRRAAESQLVSKVVKNVDRQSLPPNLAPAFDGLEKAKQVEQVIVLVGPGPGDAPGGPPGPRGMPSPKISGAGIVRFASPEVCQEFLASMPDVGEERIYNGKQYHMQAFGGGGTEETRNVPNDQVPATLEQLKEENAFLADDPDVKVEYETAPDADGKNTTITITIEHRIDIPTFPNARYLPNETTLVLAREDLLKKMMDAKEVQCPLTKRLAALGNDRDLYGVVLADGVRAPLQEFVQQLPPQMMQPPVSNLVHLADGVKAITVIASADASPLAQIEITAADEDVAENAHRQFTAMLQLGQGMFSFMQQSAPEQPPETKKLMQVAGEVLNDLSLEQHATLILLTVPRTDSLDSIGDWIGPLAQAAGQSARAKDTQRIVNALLQVFDAHGPLTDNVYGEDGAPLLSWRAQLLPALGQSDLHARFHQAEAWDSPSNAPLLLAPWLFDGPNAFCQTPGVEPGHTVYLSFRGAGAMLDPERDWRDIDLKDGISGTIAFIEVSPERAVPWTKPADIDLSAKDVPAMLGPPPTPQGYPAIFFDGRVVTLPPDIDLETLRKLAGFDDGVPPGYELKF